jgi:hypothetical protein
MGEKNWKQLLTVNLPIMPVITQPMLAVMLNMWVTEEGSSNLSYMSKRELGTTTDQKIKASTGIFFCVITAQLSAPLIPIDVKAADLIALKAYSACCL